MINLVSKIDKRYVMNFRKVKSQLPHMCTVTHSFGPPSHNESLETPNSYRGFVLPSIKVRRREWRMIDSGCVCLRCTFWAFGSKVGLFFGLGVFSYPLIDFIRSNLSDFYKCDPINSRSTNV